MLSEFNSQDFFKNEVQVEDPKIGKVYDDVKFESPAKPFKGYKPVKIKIKGNRETLLVIPKDGWFPRSGVYKVRLVEQKITGRIVDNQVYHGQWTCEEVPN